MQNPIYRLFDAISGKDAHRKCMDCEWWCNVGIDNFDGYGACQAARQNFMAYDFRVAASDGREKGPVLETKPDFGCCLWRKKRGT